MSSSGARPPRRMLPSVTDVVNELARAVQADPAVLFKVSRQVVAEELGRVKQGFESASIEILAKRARRLLDPATAGEPPPAPAPPPQQPSLFNAPEPSPAAAEPAEKAAMPPPPMSSEEPFSPSSETDLGWEKDIPIQADDAPFRSAILPIPRSRMPAGIGAPDPTSPQAVPVAPASAVAPPGPRAPSAAPPEPAPPEEFELADEAEPVPAASPSRTAPPAPPAALPPAPEPPILPAAAPKAEAPSFLRSPAPAVPSAPPPLRSDERPQFVRSDTRPAFEPPPSPDQRQPIPPLDDAERRLPGRITTREWKSLGAIGVATERLADPAPRPAAASPASAGASVQSQKPRAGRGGLIAAVAVLLVAAVVVFLLRDTLFPGTPAKPENPVAARPALPTPAPPTPAPATPTPVSAAAASKSGPASKVAAKSAAKTEPKAVPARAADAAATRPPGSASGWSKGSLIVSKEWAGKPTIWVIHFSSHKDRAGAEKEAARLAAALGKTGHAIEVDLGEKGIWYRVLIGDFATPDEARAYHSELEAKNTPNLGFVYQLRGE